MWMLLEAASDFNFFHKSTLRIRLDFSRLCSLFIYSQIRALFNTWLMIIKCNDTSYNMLTVECIHHYYSLGYFSLHFHQDSCEQLFWSWCAQQCEIHFSEPCVHAETRHAEYTCWLCAWFSNFVTIETLENESSSIADFRYSFPWNFLDWSVDAVVVMRYARNAKELLDLPTGDVTVLCNVNHFQSFFASAASHSMRLDYFWSFSLCRFSAQPQSHDSCNPQRPLDTTLVPSVRYMIT